MLLFSLWVTLDSLRRYGREPPGSSVYGILQARILEWAAISSAGGPSRPGDWTRVYCNSRRTLQHWATRGGSELLIFAYYPFTACGAHSGTPVFPLILLTSFFSAFCFVWGFSREITNNVCACVFILSSWLMRLQRLGGSKIWSERLEGRSSSPKGVCHGNQEALMLPMKSEDSPLENLLAHGGQPLFSLVF